MNLIMLFVGLTIASVAYFLLWKMKGKQIKETVTDLRLKMEAAEKKAHQSEIEKASLEPLFHRSEEQVQELRSDLTKLSLEVKTKEEELRKNEARIAELQEQLQGEEKLSKEKLRLLDNARLELEDSFKALAAAALKSNNEQFLSIAEDKLQAIHKVSKDDLKNRQDSVDKLVQPLQKSLENYEKGVNELERKRESAYIQMVNEIKHLSVSNQKLDSETSKLVQALRKPVVRGRWGEIQLRKVVEMAGMLNKCDFDEQVSTKSGDTSLRPDMLINMPSNRIIVIDSKVPLEHYLNSLEMEDGVEREESLKRHSNSIREHIKNLSNKSYWDQFDKSPEFVVLFLPGEPFYSAALENDPSLIEFGVNKKVIIATPTTLIALLKAVAYGWKQEDMTQNAVEVSTLGKELYERLITYTEHFFKVGEGLKKSVEYYNKAVGSFESRVLISARKFPELGISTSKSIVDPAIIDIDVRQLNDRGEDSSIKNNGQVDSQ